MNTKLFIPIILGTNRAESNSRKVAEWLLGETKKRSDIETQLFNTSDFKLPQNNCCQAIKDEFPEYKDAIIRADGLIIVSPEYNHGYPGVLKSVLDLLLKEYFHKAVGLVGVSGGVLGGARCIESLNQVMRELGLTTIFKDLNIISVRTLFDEQGNILDDAYNERAANFLNELVWMARTLKWGRENIPSEYRQ